MLGFNIDSLTLYKERDELVNFDRLEKKLDRVTIIKNGKFKNWKQGYYKNFYVKLNDNIGIYIKGSISNYSAGYDSILDYNHLEVSIKQLERELNINLHCSKIYRIDLALNIPTNNSISEYTHRLFLDLPRFRRLEQVDGVRFETGKIKIAIYNKTKELHDKRKITLDSNILRIEFRVFKGISKVIGVRGIKIEDLLNPSNYLQLLYQFKKYYQKIKKQVSYNYNFNNSNNITPSQFKEQLLIYAIDKHGGANEIYKQIEQLSIEGRFKSPTEKSRCRKIITELSSKSRSKPHPLREEIDTKVYIAFSKEIKRFINK